MSSLGRLWADPADSFRSEPQKTTSEGMSWSKVKNSRFPPAPGAKFGNLGGGTAGPLGPVEREKVVLSSLGRL